jgi:hypothetical protein
MRQAFNLAALERSEIQARLISINNAIETNRAKLSSDQDTIQHLETLRGRAVYERMLVNTRLDCFQELMALPDAARGFRNVSRWRQLMAVRRGEDPTAGQEEVR